MKFAYQDKKSPIHRIHPIAKIIWVLAVLTFSILIDDPVLLFLLFLSTIPFVIIGRILKEWYLFLKFALFLSLIIIIINVLASQHGSHIIYRAMGLPILGNIKITLESLVFGIGMSLRLISTISAFAILTLTINPDVLLQTILLLKIPQRTVFITSLATRFIPCLLADVDKIQDSLKSRAYNMKDGGIIKRLKRRAILLPPLLSNSLERSIQSAEAMESRGFGSKGKKTFYKTIQATKLDYFFIILPLLLILIIITVWFLDIGTYEYYPTLTPISITLNYILLGSLLVFMVISLAIFSPLKKVVDLD